MTFRALFFGTPAFAVPSLEALAEIATVVGVVCQPDKPQGRHMTLTPPPVKARAEQLGFPVHQPTKLRTGEFATWVRAQNVDVALVVAYGRILPQEVLDAPRLGCVNVHGSLLPAYRGAAPITWAIVRGERETGVTLMLLDAGMDTGAKLEHFKLPIDPNETAGEMGERLAVVGADAVRRGLPRYIAGGYTPQPQNDVEATLAPMLTKEAGRIDFAQPARRVHDHVRGMTPWPGAQTALNGKTVKVLTTRMSYVGRSAAAEPGVVVLADKTRVLVACAEGTIELVRVQLEGKKPVSATDWVMGRGVSEGDRLG